MRPPPNVNPCQLIFAFPVALSSSSTRALCVFYSARRRRGRGEVEGLPFSGWWGALLSRPAIPDLIGLLLYLATPTLWRPRTRKTGEIGLGMGDEAPRVTQDKPQLNAALTRQGQAVNTHNSRGLDMDRWRGTSNWEDNTNVEPKVY